MTPDELRDIAERLIELADEMECRASVKLGDGWFPVMVEEMRRNEERFTREYRDALKAYSASRA